MNQEEQNAAEGHDDAVHERYLNTYRFSEGSYERGVKSNEVFEPSVAGE
jgi:hypothetical protein